MAVHAVMGCTASTAKSAPEPIRGALSGRYVLEQATHQRWLNAAQRPELTPFDRTTSALQLDLPSADPRTGERTIRASSVRPRSGDSAFVTVRADGGVVRQEAWLAPMPVFAVMLPRDSARFARMRLAVGGHLVLPSTRVWDLVPRVHPRRFVAGAGWTDTLALAAGYDGARQALDGVRTSVLVRDTMIAARRFWIIRDSARVRYTEHRLEVERTLDTLVSVDRTVTGTMRGRYLYDPELAFLRERDDTTSLAGDAVLRYPDGRSFRTPTRYERTRRWTLYEPDAFAARQAAANAERSRTWSGPVMSPSTDVERRLAAGDSALRDSLATVWERERDPDRRLELYRLLTGWGPDGQAFRAALDARRIAAGDSAFMLDELARRAYPARLPVDAIAARQMIRVMRDPGIAFALGASRDALYENLVQTLVTWPPALTPDTSRRRCTPEACRLLEEQWRAAQEPRLRDVGLAALATRDPVQWADSAIARAASGSSLLVPVVQLANGVGATWPAAAKLPLPAAGADWRAWMAWSNADDPRYRAPLATPGRRNLQNQMRFEETHATAIRFHELRTGRDVLGELRRQLTAAPDDSARLVFGTILLGLGDLPAVEQVAAQLRSGSAPQIALAQRSLSAIFGARAPRADSATAAAILDRLIASTVDRSVPWPDLAAPAVPNPPPRAPAGVLAEQRYLLADNVPPALRERWRNRVTFVSAEEWRALPIRGAATLLTLSGVERVGPFVRVRVDTSGRLARQPNETPRLFHSGTTYYLLARGDGWVVVATDMWIT